MVSLIQGLRLIDRVYVWYLGDLALGYVLTINENFYVITTSRLFQKVKFPATATVRIMMRLNTWIRKVEIKYFDRGSSEIAVMHVFSEGEGIQWDQLGSRRCAYRHRLLCAIFSATVAFF